MTASERLQFLDYTFLDFQGTIMCQKQLMKNPPTEAVPLEGIFYVLNLFFLFARRDKMMSIKLPY